MLDVDEKLTISLSWASTSYIHWIIQGETDIASLDLLLFGQQMCGCVGVVCGFVWSGPGVSELKSESHMVRRIKLVPSG